MYATMYGSRFNRFGVTVKQWNFKCLTFKMKVAYGWLKFNGLMIFVDLQTHSRNNIFKISCFGAIDKNEQNLNSLAFKMNINDINDVTGYW